MGCECCEGKCDKEVRVFFCPKCKSRTVRYVFGFGNIFGIIPKMRCKDCGFEATTFPILVASQEDIKKAVEGMKARRVKKIIKRRVVQKKVKIIKKMPKKVIWRRR